MGEPTINPLVTYLDERPEIKTLAIVDNQWGDTGKGKIVSSLSDWADIIARGTGGANAGHTIYQGGERKVLHLVPCGILTPDKINVIGRGVAVDPAVVLDDLKQVERPSTLLISKDAHLVLPQHILRDCSGENSAAKIGTTGRGIGPCYQDHVARIGLKVLDLLNPDLMRAKIVRNLEFWRLSLTHKDFLTPQLRALLLTPQFYAYKDLWSVNDCLRLNAGSIVDRYRKYGEALKGMIIDTDAYLQERVGKDNILLEGSQGVLLSDDYGTYPYVTCCDCSRYGLARGVGLHLGQVDVTFGTVKAFAMTRVGKGAFPTEFGGETSEKWCNSGTRQEEQRKYPNADINSHDSFEQGVAIRSTGGEYGSTTGRLRRVGRLDLPLLRHAIGINGPKVILMKLDMLSSCESIDVCNAYEYDGPSQYVCHGRLGEVPVLLQKGEILRGAFVADEVLRQCKAQYERFPGWMCDISGITNQADLPPHLQKIISFVEQQTGAEVIAGSVGPENDQLFMNVRSLVRA